MVPRNSGTLLMPHCRGAFVGLYTLYRPVEAWNLASSYSWAYIHLHINIHTAL